MLASRNESTTAGPACSAATVPVNTKMPAPIVLPTPKHVRLNMLSVCGSFALAGVRATRASMDLRAYNLDMSGLVHIPGQLQAHRAGLVHAARYKRTAILGLGQLDGPVQVDVLV